MPPSKSPAPVYRYHVSGNAQVRLCGKDFYLGPHGSPESYSRYHALLAEYNANGMKLPEGVPQHQMSQEIRVRDVTADFREIELQRYVDNSGVLASPIDIPLLCSGWLYGFGWTVIQQCEG